ncbi:MAG: LysR family transcriptional regulator [Roseicyclus sp.]|nr:LysR family transcriptional regulator [Roseicyclus sp.]
MTNFNNIRMFVRVFELENMSAAARDLQLSAAVASSRVGELEKQLGIRLFTRTTRSIQPTEQGRIFYPKALKVLEALEEAEAAVHEVTLNPRGSIFVSAPLGIGRRYIAPFVALFREEYPEVHTRLRLSDRSLDLTGEGLDVAFVIGNQPDSGLMMKPIATLPRVLCAAPSYVARQGMPMFAADLINNDHQCLLLRFPGSTEFRWTLHTTDGFQKFDVTGPYACDDGDVLTNWALDGRGIVNKPRFEVSDHLDAGRLVEVCTQSPPPDAQLALLYPHKKNQDSKSRFFIDFMCEKLRATLP